MDEIVNRTLCDILVAFYMGKIKKYLASNDCVDRNGMKHNNKGQFCGSTGQAAIYQMIKQQKGIIKNAFYRKDIGHIDLIWGDGSKGLSHILKRRGKDEKQNIDEFIADLANVIQKGKRSDTLNDKGRWEISLDGKTAIIEPIETNGKQTFLLSAYKSRKA